MPEKRIGDILRPRNEIIHPKDRPTGKEKFVGLEHIESGTGIRIGFLEVEKSKLTGRKARYYKGDIVYGYLRPYLNKVWVAEFDGLCSVDQYVYTVETALADTTFLAWFMRSPVFLERAPISTSPGQLPRIRSDEVAEVRINLPPLADQRRIGAEIEMKMSALNRMSKSIETQLVDMDKIRAALLAKAFAGEL